jgi:hypothetical protein
MARTNTFAGFWQDWGLAGQGKVWLSTVRRGKVGRGVYDQDFTHLTPTKDFQVTEKETP